MVTRADKARQKSGCDLGERLLQSASAGDQSPAELADRDAFFVSEIVDCLFRDA